MWSERRVANEFLRRAACRWMDGTKGGRGGAGLVFTEQKRQARVQVSPRSMMVAVATLDSPPPQHSPMLGHRPSWQIVAIFFSFSWGRGHGGGWGRSVCNDEPRLVHLHSW